MGSTSSPLACSGQVFGGLPIPLCGARLKTPKPHIRGTRMRGGFYYWCPVELVERAESIYIWVSVQISYTLLC